MNNTFIINNEMHIISQIDEGIWHYIIKRGEEVKYDREVTKGRGIAMLREFTDREIKKLGKYL